MASVKGGDKVAKILSQIGSGAKGSVNVGFLSGATYPDGTSVAQVAFWNEFGHGGTFPAPARPFFRNMISKNSKDWPAQVAAGLKYYQYDGLKVLEAMGGLIRDELQESISTIDGPALSPTTLILRQKFGNNPQDIRITDVLAAQQAVLDGETGASGTGAKPLVWTGHLLRSVDYEVKE